MIAYPPSAHYTCKSHLVTVQEQVVDVRDLQQHDPLDSVRRSPHPTAPVPGSIAFSWPKPGNRLLMSRGPDGARWVCDSTPRSGEKEAHWREVGGRILVGMHLEMPYVRLYARVSSIAGVVM